MVFKKLTHEESLNLIDKNLDKKLKRKGAHARTYGFHGWSFTGSPDAEVPKNIDFYFSGRKVDVVSSNRDADKSALKISKAFEKKGYKATLSRVS